MIDRDLVDELDATSLRIGAITKLPSEAADEYVRRLAATYVADPSSLWWWTSLKVRAVHQPYGKADGLSRLAELIGKRNDAVLIVTDDEQSTWSVYAGDVQSIISMLRQSRFFEYILAARDGSWIVFDTHTNELVSAGLDA